MPSKDKMTEPEVTCRFCRNTGKATSGDGRPIRCPAGCAGGEDIEPSMAILCKCGYRTAYTRSVLMDLGLANVIPLHAMHPRHGAEVESIENADTEKCYELIVRCVAGDEAEARYMVPTYMVGAAVIVFHTAHEGHPLTIEYRGHKVTSPSRDMRRSLPRSRRSARLSGRALNFQSKFPVSAFTQ